MVSPLRQSTRYINPDWSAYRDSPCSKSKSDSDLAAKNSHRQELTKYQQQSLQTVEKMQIEGKKCINPKCTKVPKRFIKSKNLCGRCNRYAARHNGEWPDIELRVEKTTEKTKKIGHRVQKRKITHVSGKRPQRKQAKQAKSTLQSDVSNIAHASLNSSQELTESKQKDLPEKICENPYCKVRNPKFYIASKKLCGRCSQYLTRNKELPQKPARRKTKTTEKVIKVTCQIIPTTPKITPEPIIPSATGQKFPIQEPIKIGDDIFPLDKGDDQPSRNHSYESRDTFENDLLLSSNESKLDLSDEHFSEILEYIKIHNDFSLLSGHRPPPTSPLSHKRPK